MRHAPISVRVLVLNDPLARRALIRAIHGADGDADSDFMDLNLDSNLDWDLDESVDLRYTVDVGAHVVGWYRFTASNTVLKAPMLSALEATMC